MSTNPASEAIEKWIMEFLSKPSKVFDDLPPCPYARKAWLDNKVEVKEIIVELEPVIEYYINNWPGHLDVVLLLMDPTEFSSEYLHNICEMYKNDKIVILDDHPDIVESVKDVRLNQGEYAILFLQCRDMLEKARDELRKTKYYDNYDKEYLKEVISR